MLDRAASPNDATALAELIYIADQAHYSNSAFDLTLGGTRASQLQAIAKLTTTEARSLFHYSHFEVAEINGQVVASVAGFDKLIADPLIAPALEQIGWTPEAVQSLDQELAAF